MSMRSVCCLSLAVFVALPVLAESPRLGAPIDQQTLTAIDYTILPDGDGLPPGSGTAVEGLTVYRQNCLACHGEGGSGSVNDVLAGGIGSLASDKPLRTIGSFWPYATTVFDYVRRAMPLPNPGVLSDDELYAVTAYLLYVNDIIGENELMSAKSLPLVQMPNRDGFTREWQE